MPPTTAPRSSAAQRRRKPAAKDNSPGVEIQYKGKKYAIRQSDLTPRDVVAIRKETGFAGWVGLIETAGSGFDLDVLAAFLWLARRHAGDDVSYETVLDSMDYEALADATVEDQRKPADEVESPEA